MVVLYIGGIMLCRFGSSFLSNTHTLHQKKAEREMKVMRSQLTALKAQMNPHFMFNTLNSLQSLILSGDVKGSNYYLTRFSALMRQVLQVSEKEEISLKEEIDMLNNYLELEKLRFGNDFVFEIKWEGENEAEDIMIPSMLIQPFVENAVKHGLLHKKGKKKLNIYFHTNAVVTCIIEDNGIGRERSREINKNNKGGRLGFSTAATEKRIELFNSFGKKGFDLNIEDLKEGSIPTGTRVTITFPYHS